MLVCAQMAVLADSNYRNCSAYVAGKQIGASMIGREESYECGASFAQDVQAGLVQGKSFGDMNAFTPEEATRQREYWEQSKNDGLFQYSAFYAGYLSRWD